MIMASIIVPTDFSENAYNALFYASQLFPAEDCSIYLVHSYERSLNDTISKMDPVANEVIIAKLRATVHSQLEQLSHRIQLDCAGQKLKVELMYAALPLNDIINDLIENLDVHFVVMGTKGASGLKEIFLGSQAVDTIKNINPIPLFLIPENVDYVCPKKIAYATDLKQYNQQENIAFLIKMINAKNSKLELVHFHDQSDIFDEVQPHFEKFKDQLKDVEFTTHWMLSEHSLEADIKNFCEKQSVHLLVLLLHKYSFLKNLIKTSTVEKISFQANLPLLILPE